MTRMPVNRSGKQLQKTMCRLRAYLRSEFATGDRIPNEQALAERFAVSRATIRETVTRFASEGLLEKRWGVGTFVCEPDLLGDLGVLALWPGVAAALGRLGGTVSIPFGNLERGGPDAVRFPDFPDSTTATLERVFSIDGVCAVYTRETMIVQYIGGTVEFGQDWTRVPVPNLLGHVGVSISKQNFCLSSRLAAGEAERLSVSTGEPVLVATGEALDQQGRRFVQVMNVVRTDIVRTTVSSTLSPD